MMEISKPNIEKIKKPYVVQAKNEGPEPGDRERVECEESARRGWGTSGGRLRNNNFH